MIRRILLWLAMATLAGCSERSQQGDKQVVAATIFPLGSLVAQIVGEDVEVVTLLPPGISEHVFEPTSSQMQSIGTAKLIVAVGLGLDHWVHGAMDATGKSDDELFDAVVALGMSKGEAHEHEHEHAEGSSVDPHIWLDPVMMRQLVPLVAERLKAALPEHVAAIDANAAKLVDEIDAIDVIYREQLEPFRGKTIVTYHPAFGRPAERYGLIVGATLHTVGTPTSPLENLQASIGVVRERGLKVIFAEPQLSPDAAEMMRRETGVEVLTLDPLGDPRAADRDSWQKLMKYNLEMLVKGLSL